MTLDLKLLTTVNQCENAIEITELEKVILERRLRNLGESLTDKAKRTTSVKEGIVSVEAIILGYQSALNVITDAKAKRDLELKIEREETKLKALQNRDANYNAVNVLEDQITHQQLQAQIDVFNNAITSITAYKDTLTSA